MSQRQSKKSPILDFYPTLEIYLFISTPHFSLTSSSDFKFLVRLALGKKKRLVCMVLYLLIYIGLGKFFFLNKKKKATKILFIRW